MDYCRWIIVTTKTTKKNTVIVIAASALLLCVAGLLIYIVIGSFFLETISRAPDIRYGNNLGNHSIFYKTDWKGNKGKRIMRMPHPVGLVIISHTNSLSCSSFKTCSKVLRTLQYRHMDNGLRDIGFNFAVGGDGNIYVGRGWDNINSHPQLSVGVSFIGNFNLDDVNTKMMDGAQMLLQQGLKLGKLSHNYWLVAHNQSCLAAADSPGTNVFSNIKKWQHYKGYILYNNTDGHRHIYAYLRRFINCDFF